MVSDVPPRPGPFVWPPRRIDRTRLESPGPAVAVAPAIVADEPPRVLWWSQVERAWLAPVAEPLALRAAAALWAPDELGAFCDRCGSTVGAGEADEFGCALCAGRRVPWDRAVRLGEFDGALRDWVHEVKFTRFRALGVSLGRLLGERLLAAGLRSGPAGERVAVVPAPMSFRRRLFRGVDHARVIAQGVARKIDAPLCDGLARRHRPSQLSVPASERARNVARAIRCRPGVEFGGWTVVLVDDVRTTGATLAACARAAKRGPGRPAALWAAALAVTPDRGRLGLVGIPRRAVRPGTEPG